jgi:putative tryptophan/tyrosine transport system substrate-binding protein
VTFAVDVRSPNEIDAALKSVPRLRPDAIMVLGSPVIAGKETRIAQLVAALRLPAIYENEAYTAAGGLMVYGASEIAIWRRAATYVARILKGAKAAELPVERPTIFELTVNLKTARALGITVPESILLQATQVIR